MNRSATARLGLGLIIAFLGLAGMVRAGEPGFDPSLMDRSVEPGDDFYRYACGSWIDRTELPDGVPRYNTYSENDEAMIATVIRILDAASGDSSLTQTESARSLGAFYASAMDTATIDRLGVAPLSGEMKRIEKISNQNDLQHAITRLQLYGFSPLFRIDEPEEWRLKETYELLLRPAGLGLPGTHYYARSDTAAESLRSDYADHVARMFELLGEDSATARQRSGVVLRIENRLAAARSDRSGGASGGDYSVHSVESLDKLMSAFDWGRYFAEIGASGAAQIQLDDRRYFKELDSILEEFPLSDWQTYLSWVLVDDTARYLSHPFRKAQRRFFSVRLRGHTKKVSREERAFFTIDSCMPEAVGLCYREEAFPPETEAMVLEMTGDLKAAFRRRIQSSAIIGKKEKSRHIEKLDSMKILVGGPDEYYGYAGLKIDRSEYLWNALRSRRYNTERRIAKCGQPVDHYRWRVYPQSMSGWYYVNQNQVIYPAASIQPPLFVPGGDPASNYGAMGTGIAHEITHGFDVQGRQFDAKGKHRGWWVWLKSRFGSDQNEKLLVDQFDSSEALEGYFVSGEGTLMENMADLGGLVIAWDALQLAIQKGAPDDTIDGFTSSQRFFLAYAQKWKEVIDEDHLTGTLAGPHAPARFRASNPLCHLPAFYEAFDIKPGEAMWRDEDERAELW